MIEYNLPEWAIPVFVIAIMWEMFWKFLSMWHAARKGNKPWFFILFIFNTMGILDIFYIFYIAKVKPKKLFK